MSYDAYLISKDAGLIRHFEGQQKTHGTKITSLQTPSAVSINLSSCPLLLIDSEENWEQALKEFKTGKKEGQAFYAIISNRSSLEKTSAPIYDIALHLNGHLETPTPESKDTSLKEKKEHELHLSQLLEKKFSDFVRKVKHSRPKNLYHLLISELERPLFNFALKELDGNQVRAAELLGVHRNTLRKKIKELKISVKKRNARQAKVAG